jgi:hypothetical protein
MIARYKFNKEGGSWYIVLPDYPGPKADLQMVAGADTMLDVMAQGKESVELLVSETPVSFFDELVKLDKNDLGSGAYYNLQNYQGQELNHEMWLCDVTKFIFGDFPPRLFIKQA